MERLSNSCDHIIDLMMKLTATEDAPEDIRSMQNELERHIMSLKECGEVASERCFNMIECLTGSTSVINLQEASQSPLASYL
jgi:hypothetical protein